MSGWENGKTETGKQMDPGNVNQEGALTARIDDVSGNVFRGDLWGNGDFWDDMLDLSMRNGGGVELDGGAVSLSQYGLGTGQRNGETYTRHEGFFDERRDYRAFPYTV